MQSVPAICAPEFTLDDVVGYSLAELSWCNRYGYYGYSLNVHQGCNSENVRKISLLLSTMPNSLFSGDFKYRTENFFVRKKGTHFNFGLNPVSKGIQELRSC